MACKDHLVEARGGNRNNQGSMKNRMKLWRMILGNFEHVLHVIIPGVQHRCFEFSFPRKKTYRTVYSGNTSLPTPPSCSRRTAQLSPYPPQVTRHRRLHPQPSSPRTTQHVPPPSCPQAIYQPPSSASFPLPSPSDDRSTPRSSETLTIPRLHLTHLISTIQLSPRQPMHFPASHHKPSPQALATHHFAPRSPYTPSSSTH